VASDRVARVDVDALRAEFDAQGQGHVFRFWERLDDASRERLASQAAGIDLSALPQVGAEPPRAPQLEPLPVEALPDEGGDPERWAAARMRGTELIREGRVALMVVAGGQASRLGYPGPKGLFPLGPVSDRSLFAQQAQKIRHLRASSGQPVPWYVMTSPATDDATRRGFEQAAWFGLPREDVFFFSQAMVPSLDFEGRLILEAPDRIFENPNGHGGSLTALLHSGALDDMARRGIDTIHYYQVDNPLAQLSDAAFLGFHALTGADMSCKVVRKQEPGEKVGVVARIDGRAGVVEYTEIDDAQRTARDETGQLRYWAGNMAIHVFAADFARRVSGDADALLPYHASAKKIPVVDAEGQPTAPDAPNGHKLERFVFDALAAAREVCVVEARREHEYSPVKNAEGSDSPETARRDLVLRYRAWLEEAGIEPPPPGHAIEIDESRIAGPEDVRALGIRSLTEAGDAIRTAVGAPA
jgi:UDP-N-acetylglucosamine/UDP-N-acetylgalactosamine diphosphorylase